MAKVGRPSLFTPELAEEICYRLSNGEDMGKICSDSHMPDKVNVWKWRRDNVEFRNMISEAQKDKAETLADSMTDIEEMVIRGELEPAAANVILTSRRWKTSKYFPKLYGDKTQIESENINHNLNTEIPLSEADMAILSRFKFDV